MHTSKPGLWVLLSVAFLFTSAPAFASDRQAIYRYLDGRGREVFVNDLSRVPRDFRQQASLVDLSAVSLNREIGEGLSKSASEQLARLLRSPYCFGQRAEARRGWLRMVWQDYGHLLLCALAALALLVITPRMSRSVGERWQRGLLIMLPALAFVALLGSAAWFAGGALRGVRERAEACQPESYRVLKPRARVGKMRLLQRLVDQTKQVNIARDEAIKRRLQ